jgi:translation elongation factor aEF-1 beta
MGIALIKYKIMPEGIPKSFEVLKKDIQKNVENCGGKLTSIQEEPLAFGLSCLIASVSIDETKETTPLEDSIKSLPGISSLDVIDYRRALE